MQPFFFSYSALSQDFSRFPKEVQAVFTHIIKFEPLEKSDSTIYQLRPRDFQIADIDEDGTVEVFLLLYPHYNTSPTIVVYQVTAKNQVKRIKEGLAPGRLVARNNEYLSFHPLGLGVDFVINNNDNNYDSLLTLSFLESKSHVIVFKKFIHFDSRHGEGSYIDFSHQEQFLSETTCQSFQFAMPSEIIVGRTKTISRKCLFAKVDDEIYCYIIKGISSSGLIDKEYFVSKLPIDFIQFKLTESGYVNYLNKSGQIVELNIK